MAPSQSPCQAIYSSSITWCLFLNHVPVMLRQPLDLHWLQKSASISYLKDSTYHALDIWSKSALWPVNPHSPSHNLPLPPGLSFQCFPCCVLWLHESSASNTQHSSLNPAQTHLLREAFLGLQRDPSSGLPSIPELATLEARVAAASTGPAAICAPRCLIFFSTQRPLHQGPFLLNICICHCVNFRHHGAPWEMIYFILLEERAEAFLETARLPWGMFYAPITLQKSTSFRWGSGLWMRARRVTWEIWQTWFFFGYNFLSEWKMFPYTVLWVFSNFELQ